MTISQIVKQGVEARRAQERLTNDPADDEDWNWLSGVVRRSLKRAASNPAHTIEELLAKALLLALVVNNEGQHDQRYQLARSLLDDMEAMSIDTGIIRDPRVANDQ